MAIIQTNPGDVLDGERAPVSDGFQPDMLLAIDRSRPRELRAQLEHHLREAIYTRRLAPGSPLPPSRALATQLQIARSVVVEAYSQLRAEGYLEARQGSGTRVRADGARSHRAPAASRSRIASATLQFHSGVPDPATFPRRAWLRHYREVVTTQPDSAFGYPEPQGAIELRAALAAYLARVRAVRTTPEQMLICGGFSQALVLLCRALALRGATRIAVEDPCFSMHRRLIRAAGLDPVPVPVDADGIDVCDLSRRSVSAVLVAPAHTYPTGTVLSSDRRVALLQWAQDNDTIVIEDDYDAEFRYDRAPIGSLQGLDPAHVVYGGSASKTLSPSLRLGWLAAPGALIADVLRAKFVDDIATETLGQLTLARFIERGDLTRHLLRVRPIYRRRRDQLIAALARHLPEARVVGAAAGLHLLVQLPPHLREEDVAAAARDRGVHVEGAARHYADRRHAPPSLLIGYGKIHDTAIEEGITRLSAAVHALT